MQNVAQIVAEAISESIADNKIVTIDYRNAADRALHTDVLGQLSAESDDNVSHDTTSPEGWDYRMHEYWGTDDGGNEWRVHIQTRRAEES